MFSKALDGALMALAALLLAGPAAGQEPAKPGQIPAAEKEVVHSSPMVLEMPANLFALRDGEGVSYGGFERNVCEDVRLTKLAVSKTSFSYRKRDVYAFKGVIAVGDSRDWLVYFELELLVEGKKIAGERFEWLDGERNREIPFALSLTVSPESAQNLLMAGSSGTILRVTVAVKDNPRQRPRPSPPKAKTG